MGTQGLEQKTQRTAATAEQSAAAAQELTAQSELMRQGVEELGAMIGRTGPRRG